MDSFHVVRTNVEKARLGNVEAVKAYKNLGWVKWAFRFFKTCSLQFRPVYHRREDRVRSHLFLCMLAYYVEWNMHRQLAPLLFTDEDSRPVVTPVASPRLSEEVREKQGKRCNGEGLPVCSFANLQVHLNGLCVAD